MEPKYPVTEGVFKCEMFLKQGEPINGGPQVVEGPLLFSWMGLLYPDGSMDAASATSAPDWQAGISLEERENGLRGQLAERLASFIGRRILESKGATLHVNGR